MSDESETDDDRTLVRVHEDIGKDGVIVELRPPEHDHPAERDMEHLSESEARELYDQLGDYLDGSDGGGATVTAARLEERFFTYPVTCSECGAELAGAEENGTLGTGDVLAVAADGRPLCHEHPELTHFVAAGTYAHGNMLGDHGRAFDVQDAVAVRTEHGEIDE